jgi:hypothetical protein
MRRAILRLSCLSSLALAAACGGGTGGNLPEAPRARTSGDYISTAEVRANGFENAYDAVQSLRSTWLTRTRTSPGFSLPAEVVIYYNNARLGGPETLRQIPLATVTWMRYFDAKSAQYRWGTGHPQGVILVSTQSEQTTQQAGHPSDERRP